MKKSCYVAIVLGFMLLISRSVSATSCTEYDSREISLKGTLITQTYPGRPNYESIAKGDEAEACWVLLLETPLRISEYIPKSLESNEPCIKVIQLINNGQDVSNFVGKPIIATGSIFEAQTGHHHTPFMLNLRSITAQTHEQ